SPSVTMSMPGAVPLPDVPTLSDELIRDPEPDIPADAPALLFGTSGSTAISKIVAQSHYNAAINAYAVRCHHGLRRGHRILGCLPFHHVNGVHFTLFATLA